MALNGTDINRVAINDGDNVTLKPSLTVNSTSISLFVRGLDKFMSVVQTVVPTISKIVNHYLTLLANSGIIITIVKTVNTILTVLSTSITTIVNQINKILTNTVTSIVTIITASFYYKVLSVVSTVTTTLDKLILKLLKATASVTAILAKIRLVTLSVVSNVLAVLIPNFIYFVGLLSKIYIYAEDRRRSVSLTKFRKIVVDKVRTVFITKDDLV
jgi:hypothetical protein